MTLTESPIPAPPAHLVLRLAGDAPYDALRAGDRLTVRLGREPAHGNLVAVREGGGLVLRRCRWSISRPDVLKLGRMDDGDWRLVGACDVLGVIVGVNRDLSGGRR